MEGYLHRLPISKKLEVRYKSNSFTTTCIFVIDEQQNISFSSKPKIVKFNTVEIGDKQYVEII